MGTNRAGYMRDYMRRRAARNHALGLTSAGRPPKAPTVNTQTMHRDPTSPQAIAAATAYSVRAIAREHPDGNVCQLCGHVWPEPNCPVCLDELAGLRPDHLTFAALTLQPID